MVTYQLGRGWPPRSARSRPCLSAARSRCSEWVARCSAGRTPGPIDPGDVPEAGCTATATGRSGGQRAGGRADAGGGWASRCRCCAASSPPTGARAAGAGRQPRPADAGDHSRRLVQVGQGDSRRMLRSGRPAALPGAAAARGLNRLTADRRRASAPAALWCQRGLGQAIAAVEHLRGQLALVVVQRDDALLQRALAPAGRR